MLPNFRAGWIYDVSNLCPKYIPTYSLKNQIYLKSEEVLSIKHDLDAIKSYLIVDYAARIGFTPRRIGRYYTLKEHDSVRITPVKSCFWRNATDIRDSLIDFNHKCIQLKTKQTPLEKGVCLRNAMRFCFRYCPMNLDLYSLYNTVATGIFFGVFIRYVFNILERDEIQALLTGMIEPFIISASPVAPMRLMRTMLPVFTT